MTDYTKAAIKRVKALAWALIRAKGKRVIAIRHIHHRAYCIAKPAAHYAVFVVPTSDREQYVKTDPYVCVQNDSAAPVQVGDWAKTAYISTESSGQCYVLEVLRG